MCDATCQMLILYQPDVCVSGSCFATTVLYLTGDRGIFMGGSNFVNLESSAHDDGDRGDGISESTVAVVGQDFIEVWRVLFINAMITEQQYFIVLAYQHFDRKSIYFCWTLRSDSISQYLSILIPSNIRACFEGRWPWCVTVLVKARGRDGWFENVFYD